MEPRKPPAPTSRILSMGRKSTPGVALTSTRRAPTMPLTNARRTAIAMTSAAGTPADATRVVLRLEPSRIVDLHAFVEGYDDLALLRTLDAAAGVVEVFVSPGSEEEFERLRAALGCEGLPTTRVAEAA